MNNPFSLRRCRGVYQEGYGARRRNHWVLGADYSTQVEILLRREHAHRAWNAIQAVFAVIVAREIEQWFVDPETPVEAYVALLRKAGW